MSTRSFSDLLPKPDRVLARRALGDLRRTMRRGFALVRDSFDQSQLPPPVAGIAGTFLRGVDKVAHHADAAASTVILGFLGDGDAPEGGAAADALVAALRRTLARLDATDLRVSESGVRDALGDSRAASAGVSGTDRAGILMRHLLETRAIRPREPAPARTGQTDPATPAEIVFATILMELQDSTTDPARLAASLALASALGEEIAAAGSDAAALSRLFAEFRAHV